MEDGQKEQELFVPSTAPTSLSPPYTALPLPEPIFAYIDKKNSTTIIFIWHFGWHIFN